MQSLAKLRHQRCAARHDHLPVEGAPKVDVALLNTIRHQVVHPWVFKPNQFWLKEDLRGLPLFSPQLDCLTVWEDEVSLGACFFFAVHVVVALLFGHHGFNVTPLLFDRSHYFKLSRGVEAVTSASEQLHQVLGHVSASQVDSLRCVADGVALVDGTGTAYSIAHVEHDARHHAASVQTQHSSGLKLKRGNAKQVEKHFGGLYAVLNRVEGVLSDKDRVFTRVHSQLLLEDVAIDRLHLLPVLHCAVLNRVAQLDHSLVFFLSACEMLSDTYDVGTNEEGILLWGRDHNLLVFGSAYATQNCGNASSFHLLGIEHVGWFLFASVACLDHARALQL